MDMDNDGDASARNDEGTDEVFPGPRHAFELPQAPQPDLSSCGGISLGDTLNVCTATYLGGAGSDTVSHVAISPDGTIVLGGVFPGVMGFGPRNNEFGLGGDAAAVKISADGRKILAWAHMGALVSAVAVSPQDGSVAVGGDFGVVVLDAGMQEERFRFVANAPERLSFGLAGELLHVAADRATVYDTMRDGEVLASLVVDRGEVRDMVLDSAYRRVIVTGFEGSSDEERPFLSAYDFDGSMAWSLWGDESAGTLEERGVSRGVALAIGRDGKLYFVGEAQGEGTVFAQDPRDPTRPLEVLVEPDDYARRAGVMDTMSFISRHDLRDGSVELATFLTTRSDGEGGGAAHPVTLAANQRGDVLLGGRATCCIANGVRQIVAGQEAMPDEASGEFFALFDGETFERIFWTAAHGGARARLKSVDIWGSAAVVVHEHVVEPGATTVEGSMILHESFFDEPQGGGSEVHITVIPVHQ